MYVLGDIVPREEPVLDCPMSHASSIRHWEGTVDYALYHKTIVEMEQNKVDRDYIQGWIGGFMGNPKREEQRITQAYEKGFEDGANRVTSNYQDWVAE